jgi:hypothetical protein
MSPARQASAAFSPLILPDVRIVVHKVAIPSPTAAHGPAPRQIHWFSIINSCVTVLLLTGFLATILLRVLKADFVKFSRGEDGGEGGTAGGWAAHLMAHRNGPCYFMLLKRAVVIACLHHMVEARTPANHPAPA